MSAFNGAGTFVISGPGLPYVTATVISSTVANQLNTDLATGLSTCLTKDGQTVPTNNIPMGGFRLTGVGAPVAPGDALVNGQPASISSLTVTGSPLNLIKDQNAATFLYVQNADPGPLNRSMAQFNNGGAIVNIGMFGGGFAGAGLDQPNCGFLQCSGNNLTIATTGPAPILFGTNGTEKMRLVNAGNLGLGRTPEAWTSAYRVIAIGGDSVLYGPLGGGIGLSSNSYYDGVSSKFIGNGRSPAYSMSNTGLHQWYGSNSGVAGGAVTQLLYMMLQTNGALIAGNDDSGANTAGLYSQITCKNGGTPGDISVLVGNNGSVSFAAAFNNANGFVGNASVCAMRIASCNPSGRSINAGGTVNTGGADYAEYYFKRGDCGVLTPGSLAGIDDSGKLTDQWALAANFKFKSTDPSFVGGDRWGTAAIEGLPGYDPKQQPEEWPQSVRDALEAARQSVDRITCSGKIPAILTGVFAAGDLVVPVQNGTGISAATVTVATATVDDLKMKVGRVLIANPTALQWAVLLGATFPVDPAWNAIVDI